MFQAWFCKHKWEKVSDVVTESTFEMSMRVANETCKGKLNLPHQLCVDERKHIVILKCDCGKVKKIVTKLG